VTYESPQGDKQESVMLTKSGSSTFKALVVPIGTRNSGVASEAEIVDSMTGILVAQQSLALNAGSFNSRPDAMFKRAAPAKVAEPEKAG
jgi:hypothetical protein